MQGKKSIKKIIYLIILIFILIYKSIYFVNISKFCETKKDDSTLSIEKAIRKATIQCYALEGSFPPSIQYLEENYSIIINEDAYFYHFQSNGANIFPDIQIIRRWSDE